MLEVRSCNPAMYKLKILSGGNLNIINQWWKLQKGGNQIFKVQWEKQKGGGDIIFDLNLVGEKLGGNYGFPLSHYSCGKLLSLQRLFVCLVDGKPNRKCGEIATIYQLQTVLSEIETIINNRLLTHVSDICEDTETLIPSDFLIRKYNNGSNSFLKTEEADLTL